MIWTRLLEHVKEVLFQFQKYVLSVEEYHKSQAEEKAKKEADSKPEMELVAKEG